MKPMSVDLEEDWDGKTLSTCAIGEMTRPKRLSSSQWKCMSRRDSAAYACVEFLKLLESICCRSYQKLSPPARSFTPTDYPFTSRYPNGATVTNAVSLLDRKALRTSRCLACTALPLCLRDGCWELTRGPSKRVSLTTISTNTLFGLIVGRRARAVCFSTDCLSRLSRPSPSHTSHIVTS